MTFSFAEPLWLLLLLLLPVMAWLRGRAGAAPAVVYSSLDLVRSQSGTRPARAGGLLLALRWQALALLITALARPQRGEGDERIQASGIDIVLAVDLSDSMSAEDIPPFRLAVAKDVLHDFIKDRPNARIGLIAFSGKAYIASPITLDHDYLLDNLERFHIDTVPEDGTAIGAGLAASLNRLREADSKSKIVILMTDGQNNLGRMPPETAAAAAKALGIKVYTIGVGRRGTTRIPRFDMFNQKYYVNVNVEIDEAMLRRIAETTGGSYFRADSKQTLQRVYRQIDQLEKTEREARKYINYTDLYPWWIALGLGLLLVECLLAHTLLRRVP